MASTSTAVMEVRQTHPQQPVIFTTETQYPLPAQNFMIPSSWKRYQLSQLINKALQLPQPVPFDFIIRGEILRETLGEWTAKHNIGEEETIEIEYIESVTPPQKLSSLPHEDWVSSVSCRIPGHFLTGSYDGTIHLFNQSQKSLGTFKAHEAPITSTCVIPSWSESESSCLFATASHDMTARLARIPLSNTTVSSEPLATLHLHKAPISSVVSDQSGSYLLTAGWDAVIGLWTTQVPSKNEIELEHEEHDRKRRRIADKDVKRKAPEAVFKSHTARVSKAIFASEGKQAYSCGFDSTVRTWDIENAVCVQTIAASEKPMVDLCMASSLSSSVLCSASTDRTVTIYDLRQSAISATASVGQLSHSSTPSCVCASPSNGHQVITGAYDGVVRLWDLRSLTSATATFNINPPGSVRKVLGLDWWNGLVGVGSEGGLDVWAVADKK